MELSKKMFVAAVAGSMALGSAGGAVTHKMTATPKVVTVVPQEKGMTSVPKAKPKAQVVKKEVKKVVVAKPVAKTPANGV